MTLSRQEISRGEVVITESDVNVKKMSGRSVVVSGGNVKVETLTGGASILARGTVHIVDASSETGPVATSNVTVEKGIVRVVDAKSVLNHKKLKPHLEFISVERVEDIMGVEQMGVEQEDDTAESKHRDIHTTRREDKSEGEDDDNDIISTDMSDDELAIVVVADVLDLLSDDNERYYTDRLILLEQYPELELVLEKANSVEDVTQITEEVEGLDFSDDQIRLMKRYQNKLDDSVSLKELEY